MLPGRQRRTLGIERLLVRLVSTGGVVGIGVALGAILTHSHTAGLDHRTGHRARQRCAVRDPLVLAPAMKDLHGGASSTVNASPEQCLALLADVEGYQAWYPDVVRSLQVLDRDPEGRATKAQATLHAAVGPIARDLPLTLAVTRSAGTVSLSRVPHKPSDPESSRSTGGCEGTGNGASAARARARGHPRRTPARPARRGGGHDGRGVRGCGGAAVGGAGRETGLEGGAERGGHRACRPGSGGSLPGFRPGSGGLREAAGSPPPDRAEAACGRALRRTRSANRRPR